MSRRDPRMSRRGLQGVFPHASPAAFTPASLPNLALWLRADLGFTSGGGAQWADQSGHGNTFTGGGGANPTYSATGGPNGLPCIQFNGSQYMTSAATVTSITQNWTMFIVVQLSAGGLVDFQGIFGTGQATGFGFAYDGTKRAIDQIGVGDYEFGGAQTTNWEAWGNYDTSGINNTCFLNGSPVTAAGNIVPTAGGAAGSTLGSFASGADALQGNIAEFFLYTATLSTAQLAQINAYILTRYGL
jgi:hypothetical protein